MDETNNRPKKSSVRAEDLEEESKENEVLKRVWPSRVMVFFIILAFLGLFSFGAIKFFESLGLGNIFNLAYNFAKAPTESLASDNGRVNILVMGKAGGSRSQDSPDLTDTMILISVSLTKPNITIISIPRDLWIPEIRAKINAAYYWGDKTTPYFDNSKNPGGKIAFAKSTTSEVVGKPIQYGVVIDFSAFKDVINTLGGIEVNVANSFTDKLYPIEGKENDTCGGNDPTFACRYETISFNSGPQTMNGDTALIFVRSRHADGVEGGDQAREARQQKVIDAIKNKLMQPKIFLSIKTDLALISIAQKYIETDMDNSTIAILSRVVLRDYKTINQYLIPTDLLITPPVSANYDFQQVFIPKAGSGKWDNIQKWFAVVLQ